MFEEKLHEAINMVDRKAYFINRMSGDVINISEDIGDGSNDHIGFIYAYENKELFKLTDEEQSALKQLYETAEYPDNDTNLLKAYEKIRSKWIRISKFGDVVGVDVTDFTGDLSIVQQFILDHNWSGKIIYEDWSEDHRTMVAINDFVTLSKSELMRRS
ncbi:MAG: hypothetical protein GF411_14425 [Candidatus Lokiarchaeota archaeon]|nr:hypothetical protein [Candidatus Lokiarchaeota archaeon]